MRTVRPGEQARSAAQKGHHDATSRQVTVRAATFGATYGAADASFKDVPLISINEDTSREVILGQNPDLLLSYGLISTGWADLKAVGINELIVEGQCDDQASDGPNLDNAVTFENFYRDI